jgi:hypothetical protein
MIMSVYSCNMNLELQQRAVEYNAVIKKFANLRDGLFEQMPPIEMKERYLNDESLNANDEPLTEEEQRAQQEKNKEEVAKTLLDLFDDDTGTAGSSPQPPHIPADLATNGASILDLFDQPAPSVNKPAVAPTQTSSNMDLLFELGSVAPSAAPAAKSNQDIMDLFGGGSSSTSNKPLKTPAFNGVSQPQISSNLDDIFNLNSNTVPPKNPITNGSSDPNDILSLFGAPATTITTTTNSQAVSDDIFGGSISNSTSLVIVAYDKNDIKITIEPDNTQKNSLERPALKMRAYNTSVSSQLKDVLFSSAVPKSMQLQLSPPTTKIIQPMDSMSQTIVISNPTHVRNTQF